MRSMEPQGAVWDRDVRTTVANRVDLRPSDLIDRKFIVNRTNELWVTDFTYETSLTVMLYVSFTIAVLPRMIVGWQVSSSMSTECLYHN